MLFSEFPPENVLTFLLVCIVLSQISSLNNPQRTQISTICLQLLSLFFPYPKNGLRHKKQKNTYLLEKWNDPQAILRELYVWQKSIVKGLTGQYSMLHQR